MTASMSEPKNRLRYNQMIDWDAEDGRWTQELVEMKMDKMPAKEIAEILSLRSGCNITWTAVNSRWKSLGRQSPGDVQLRAHIGRLKDYIECLELELHERCGLDHDDLRKLRKRWLDGLMGKNE